MLVEQSGESLLGEATQLYDDALLAAPTAISQGNVFSIAAEWFAKAANAFKLEKKWSSAGDAFYKAGDAFTRSDDGESLEAVRFFQQSFAFFKKCGDVASSLKSFNRAAPVLKQLALFGVLAKDEMDFADYLSMKGSLIDAADHYQKSADYYDMECFPAHRDRALTSLATIQASLGKHLEAAVLFEKVAKSSSEDKLRVFGFRTHLLNALLCRLASGQSVKDVINYDTYDGWMHSSEWKFQYTLLAIIEGGLEVNIEIVASPYSRILNLNDPWKKALFDKISSLYLPNKDASTSSASSSSAPILTNMGTVSAAILNFGADDIGSIAVTPNL